MSRFTKRFRNKRNKTIKQNGGLGPENEEVRHEREGVVDMVGDKIYNSASGVATKVTDVLLNIAGLERKDAAHDTISNQDENTNNANANTNTNSTLNRATSYVSDLGANAFNKANALLSSETTKQGVKEAADSVANTIKDNLTILNDSLQLSKKTANCYNDSLNAVADIMSGIADSNSVLDYIQKSSDFKVFSKNFDKRWMSFDSSRLNQAKFQESLFHYYL
jgi:cobalamin biosynthesis protein CobT